MSHKNSVETLMYITNLVRENLNRRLDSLEIRLFEEKQKREAADLTAELLRERIQFLEDNTTAIVSYLEDRLQRYEKEPPGSNELFNFAKIPSIGGINQDDHVVPLPIIPPDVSENNIDGLKQRLFTREEQLERLSRELDNINNEHLKQQEELTRMFKTIAKSRSHCVELQVELNKERRINKDLETRLWHHSRSFNFKHRLIYPRGGTPELLLSSSNTSFNPSYSTAPNKLEDTTNCSDSTSNCPDVSQSRFVLDCPVLTDFIAEFRSDVETMCKTITELETQEYHCCSSLKNSEALKSAEPI